MGAASGTEEKNLGNCRGIAQRASEREGSGYRSVCGGQWLRKDFEDTPKISALYWKIVWW